MSAYLAKRLPNGDWLRTHELKNGKTIKLKKPVLEPKPSKVLPR